MRFAILFLAVSVAAADELDDRIRDLVRMLESEDPLVRDSGERELLMVAQSDWRRLASLLEHPDAEVRARVRQVFDAAEVIPESGKTEKMRELLKALSVQEPGSNRAATVEALLALDPAAARLVSRELRLGTISQSSPNIAVAKPGQITATFEALADGPCAAWVLPGRYRVDASPQPFGCRPLVGRIRGRVWSSSWTVIRRGETPEMAIVRNLSAMVRIPPGEKFAVATWKGEHPECTRLDVRLQATPSRQEFLEAEFCGCTLSLPEAGDAVGMAIRIYLLGQRDSRAFRVETFEDGETRGLVATALRTIPAHTDRILDPFWWVALDENGDFLTEGAFCSEEAEIKEWAEGESRRVPIRQPLPEGTRTLWMGLNCGSEQAVPAPVEVE